MARGARGFVHMLSHFRLAVQRWQCHRTKYKAANQRSSGATGLTGITQWNGRCNEYLFIRGQFLLPRSNECRIITRRQSCADLFLHVISWILPAAVFSSGW